MKSCMFCENRMDCERYLKWLRDSSLLHPIYPDGCEKFEEEKK